MEQDATYNTYLASLGDDHLDGHHHQADALEEQEPVTIPLPNLTLNVVNTQKRHHHDLVMEGVCQRCAHCGMELTDSVSVERGLGPTCSKKGYLEDPVNSDEIQAMIDLAEYPELVDLLTKRYKPQGVRGLMNGLVKVASLNRKHDVFGVCCDAIDSLGYKRLAALLRESIAAVSVDEHDQYPDYLVVWVKKAYWGYSWSQALYNIPGVRRKIYGLRGVLVPKTQKVALWNALNRVYAGYVVKTKKGAFKIKPGPVQQVR